jgi:hypothetical protein
MDFVAAVPMLSPAPKANRAPPRNHHGAISHQRGIKVLMQINRVAECECD